MKFVLRGFKDSASQGGGGFNLLNESFVRNGSHQDFSDSLILKNLFLLKACRSLFTFLLRPQKKSNKRNRRQVCMGSAYEVREGRCGMHVGMSKRGHLNMLPIAHAGAPPRLDEGSALAHLKVIPLSQIAIWELLNAPCLVFRKGIEP
jgi:hypothetical protein